MARREAMTDDEIESISMAAEYVVADRLISLLQNGVNPNVTVG